MDDTQPNIEVICGDILSFRRDFMNNHLENNYEIFIYISQELYYKLKCYVPVVESSIFDREHKTIMGYKYSIDNKMTGLKIKPVIQKK